MARPARIARQPADRARRDRRFDRGLIARPKIRDNKEVTRRNERGRCRDATGDQPAGRDAGDARRQDTRLASARAAPSATSRRWGPTVLGVTALGIPAAGAVGCRGCSEDRPYTPFAITESAALPPASSAPPRPAPSASASASFVPAPAVRGAAGARQLAIGGRTVPAPPDHWLAAALAADFDANGAEEVVAWSAPDRGRGGALWLYPATGPAREVWRLPGFVPTGEDCTLRPELTRTGPHTVTVDVTAECATAGIARAPTRSLAVLLPLADRAEVLALRLAAPAPGERLGATVRSTDRDGDGRDDVELTLALSTAATPEPVTARLEWIDRAAGPSREAREPLASLLHAARAEITPASRRGRCAGVLGRVEQLRRLAASVCAEAGTMRIFDREGNPFRCGEPTALVDALAEAEVTAALTCKDAARAVSVLTRDGWFLAPASPAQRAALVGRIEGAVTVVAPSSARLLAARVASPGGPRWSPLRFEQPEPSLLVETPAGMVRASTDGTTEQVAEPSSGAVAWPLDVKSADGVRWTSVAQACDRSELLLGFTGADAEPVPATVLAARPGVCAGRAVPAVPAPVALGFTRRGGVTELAAIVAGQTTGAPSTNAEPGTARSPDGLRLAHATALGVLVTGGERPELWRGTGLDAPVELSDCVPANGGAAVACVRGGRVVLAQR